MKRFGRKPSVSPILPIEMDRSEGSAPPLFTFHYYLLLQLRLSVADRQTAIKRGHPSDVPQRSRIHIVGLHILVDHVPMLLLLGLDVVQDLPQLGLPELEHAGVVEPRGVLFGGEQILAEVVVLLLVGGLGGVVGSEGGDLGLGLAAHGGCGALLDLIEGVQMPPLHVGDAVEELGKLGILGALGVLGILVDAELLLPLEILDEGGFLLCEYHNFLRVV